ncbi:hypothetical protein WG66_008115 [Moniliophthora roreri]|nr:hypothetical protein WG66_008115 [Moniliophthora roreri]
MSPVQIDILRSRFHATRQNSVMKKGQQQVSRESPRRPSPSEAPRSTLKC